MNWRDLGQSVAALFPALGTAVAGPGGALIGSVIAQRLGVEATPQAVEQALATDPDAYAKIRDIEEQTARAAMEDTQHARETIRNQAMQRRLALFIVPAPILLVGALIWLQPTGEFLTLATTVVGYLIGEARQVYSYYFGTSLGSKQKQNTISAAIGAAGGFRRG